MILPDLNLLVFAYNADAPRHEHSRRWWEQTMNSGTPVAIPWAVSIGFVRLMTHGSVLRVPLEASTAIGHVHGWLARRHVRVLEPGPEHLAILARILQAAGAAGRLTTDAHLAALAIEHQCELHSNDADFARFPGLRWRDPTAPAEDLPST